MFAKRNSVLAAELKQLQSSEAELVQQQNAGDEKKKTTLQIIPTTQHIPDTMTFSPFWRRISSGSWFSKKSQCIDLRMMNCQSSFIPIYPNNSVLCTQARLHKTHIFAEIQLNLSTKAPWPAIIPLKCRFRGPLFMSNQPKKAPCSIALLAHVWAGRWEPRKTPLK